MVVFMRSTVPENLRSKSGNPPTGSVVMRSTVRLFPKIYTTNADSVTHVSEWLAMQRRLRRRREADWLRRQRETGAERDARFMHNPVLAVLSFSKQTIQIGSTEGTRQK